jgi:hypothetical protein
MGILESKLKVLKTIYKYQAFINIFPKFDYGNDMNINL